MAVTDEVPGGGPAGEGGIGRSVSVAPAEDVGAVVPPGALDDPRRPLRVALLGYRADPRCGGQGVYLRNLSRELVALGHQVTVLAGPPYPELDPGVGYVPLAALGWFPPPDGAAEPIVKRPLRSWPDLVEAYRSITGHYGEPQGFSMRARRWLLAHRTGIDIVHDNQSLGPAIGRLADDGLAVVATVHHPLTVDRDAGLERCEGRRQRAWVRKWWSFVDEQAEVARRLPAVLTVSSVSGADIVDGLDVPRSRLRVVPVGCDPESFRPRPEIERIPGRVVTVSSADVPLKGLVHLIEALGRLRQVRPDAHLVVVSRVPATGAVAEAIGRLGLEDQVRFVRGLSEDELVVEHARAEVAVVPSLYEGFSLPAVEAMACGVPLVATTGGALPEVVGPDGEAGLLVPPGDPAALARSLEEVLSSPALRERLGAAGRQRVLARFTWRRCAEGTVAVYREVLAGRASAGVGFRVGDEAAIGARLAGRVAAASGVGAAIDPAARVRARTRARVVDEVGASRAGATPAGTVGSSAVAEGADVAGSGFRVGSTTG